MVLDGGRAATSGASTTGACVRVVALWQCVGLGSSPVALFTRFHASHRALPLALKVHTLPVRVGCHEYMFRRLWDLSQHPGMVHAPDAVLEAGAEYLTTTGDDGSASISSALWPMFGVLWPAGLAMAQCVDGLSLHGARLLEVGCGLGLPSMVAHRAGVDVTASDHHPLAAAFLEHNTRLNGLGPLPFARLDFGSLARHAERYDVIMASDVLYEPGRAQQLTTFLMHHLNQHATVLVLDPGRKQDAAFGRHMRALGFVVDVSSCALPGDPLGRTGRMLMCRRGQQLD